jgi:hypothetical protein
MNTPVEVLLAVAAIGGKLGIAGDKLRMLLPPNCPLELKCEIRRHKPALLELLQLSFLVIRSDALNATVLWVQDDATKECLVAAGADWGSIYTAAELGPLVRHKTTIAQLEVIHAAKQRFDGRIAG